MTKITILQPRETNNYSCLNQTEGHSSALETKSSKKQTNEKRNSDISRFTRKKNKTKDNSRFLCKYHRMFRTQSEKTKTKKSVFFFKLVPFFSARCEKDIDLND